MRRAKSRRPSTSNEHDFFGNTPAPDETQSSTTNSSTSPAHELPLCRTSSRNLVPPHNMRRSNPTSPRLQPSRSSRRKSPHISPDGVPQTKSPSSVWRDLPAPFQFLILCAGFLLFYYIIFAKHHRFDMNVNSFRVDLESLMRKANETGLADRQEEELPDIFKNIPSPTPSPSSVRIELSTQEKTPQPSPSLSPVTEDGQKTEIGNISSKRSEESQNDDSSPEREQEVTKKRKYIESKERSKTMKEKRVDRKRRQRSRKRSTQIRSENQNESEEEGLRSDASSEGKSSKHSSNNEIVEEKNSLRDIAEEKTSKQSAENDTDEGGKIDLPSRKSRVKERRKRRKDSAEDQEIEEIGNSNTRNLKSQPGRYSDSSSPSQNSMSEAENPNELESERETDMFESREEKVPTVRMDSESTSSSTARKADQSGGNQNPLLVWNHEFLGEASIKEQVFILGALSDHVSSYKPLCLDTETGEAISFTGKRKCGGFNRSSEWMEKNCLSAKASAEREYNIKIRSDEIEKEWLNSHRGTIRWVNGLTVLQMLDRSCGNIAHYAGRALMLQHVMDNIAAYAATPNKIENVLVLPSFHIMKRFLFPHNYDYWHMGLFTALVSPAKYSVGSLGEFMKREKEPFEGSPRVQLLHNFSLLGTSSSNKKFVCFRRAIVPGFLKGRFFVNDFEYPSKKPSLQSSIPNSPMIPRDSLRLRERVNSLLRKSPKLSGMSKKIILLDRKGGRRSFEKDGRENIISLMEQISNEKGYSFETVTFESKSFKEQYELVETAAIAIGIHGANLVNTLFMPPMSVLIELFPYGFYHEMYENGGNAGLKYFSYKMSTGKSFADRGKFDSVKECIQKNQDCKVHYRDSKLRVTPADMDSIANILHEAIMWCNNLHKHGNT